MTPRTMTAGNALTPRPVVRGPQGGMNASDELSQEHDLRAEKVFSMFDRMRTGEIDMMFFDAMLEALELPVEPCVAKEWLRGRNECNGLTLADFKQLYCRILSVQSPAVKTVIGRKRLGLKDVQSTEGHLRQAFKRYATDDAIDLDILSDAIASMSFPDYYGDRFDRFVSEWDALRVEARCGCSRVSYHEFVECVNMLVEFCDRHDEMQKMQAVQQASTAAAAARRTPRLTPGTPRRQAVR